MKKVIALILCLSVMLGFASCAKKVEVPSKSDVKKAAKEEYDMDFKVDSEDISDDSSLMTRHLKSLQQPQQLKKLLQQQKSLLQLQQQRIPLLLTLQTTAEATLIPILPALSMLTSMR